MTKRIFVTGGAGSVGAGVVRALLERGHEVTVLDSGIAAGFGYIEGTGAHFVKADMRDITSNVGVLDGADAIVHLAAQTSVVDSIASPLDDFKVNVDATLNLLEAARSTGTPRFVFASSNAVVGGHPSPVHEGLTPFPVSPYGAAKAAIEAYLIAYSQAYGLEGVALRFANAYGAWSAHKTSVIAQFVKAVLRGRPLELRGTGEQTRDFVNIHDVAAAVTAALDAPATVVAGEIYQIGTGRETSLLELATTLGRVAGAKVAIEHLPPSPGDVARNFSDISKARRQLDYEPTISLEQGLSDTVEWFRSNWKPVE